MRGAFHEICKEIVDAFLRQSPPVRWQSWLFKQGQRRSSLRSILRPQHRIPFLSFPSGLRVGQRVCQDRCCHRPSDSRRCRRRHCRPIIPRDDPATPGVFDGLVEVNHPGGGCWSGVTPDIRPGDVVQVLTAPGVGDQTTTANVTVTQPATKTGPGTVVMKGTAVAPGGGQYPIDQLEARIVAKNQSFVLGGKRTLRAGLGKEGSISYDGPGLTIWTATWTGLTGVNPADGLSDADRATSAVNSESRGMWLGIVPAAASENTTFEFAQIGGPTAPCTAPLAKGPSIPDMSAASDTGSSSTDNITRTTLPTFTGAVGLPDAASVNLYVDGTLNGSASVAANGSYSVTATTALTNGPHSITAGEVNAAGTATLGIGALTVTVDTTAPVMTGKAPALNTSGVSQASNVSATFSEPISGLSAPASR